jgi:hypothetical protein
MKTKRSQLLLALLGAASFFVTTRAAEIHNAAEADDIARIKALLATNASLVNLAGKDELTDRKSVV